MRDESHVHDLDRGEDCIGMDRSIKTHQLYSLRVPFITCQSYTSKVVHKKLFHDRSTAPDPITFREQI